MGERWEGEGRAGLCLSALHWVLCATREQKWGEESRPGAFPSGTSCFAQVFASGLGRGKEDPVPKLEASWKMEVCPRAAGD